MFGTAAHIIGPVAGAFFLASFPAPASKYLPKSTNPRENSLSGKAPPFVNAE